MRKWLELSITTQPFAAAIGANLALVAPPAEKSAISNPSLKEVSVSSRQIYFSPMKSISLPAERADENRVYSQFGKHFSSKTFKNVRPTMPVAPTTAIL